MAYVGKSAVSLRFAGDDLAPDEVTSLLGIAPSSAAVKGGPLKNGRIALTGIWTLKAPDQTPADIDAQVAGLLSLTTSNLDAWLNLSRRFRSDIFVGMFLEGFNEGVELAPKTLHQISERGLTLSLDIYSGSDDDA